MCVWRTSHTRLWRTRCTLIMFKSVPIRLPRLTEYISSKSQDLENQTSQLCHVFCLVPVTVSDMIVHLAICLPGRPSWCAQANTTPLPLSPTSKQKTNAITLCPSYCIFFYLVVLIRLFENIRTFESISNCLPDWYLINCSSVHSSSEINCALGPTRGVLMKRFDEGIYLVRPTSLITLFRVAGWTKKNCARGDTG